MRYRKFLIQNFKGIKETTLDLSSLTGANVFPLVGLNESGKTTLLEAVHSFAPDYISGTIVKTDAKTDKERAESRVPRHQFASFTGEIVVEATIAIDHVDRDLLVGFLKDEHDLVVDIGEIPDEFSMSRVDVFSRGDYVSTEYRLGFTPLLRTKSQRKVRAASSDEIQNVWQSIREFIPDIAYYPTFIFDFPERIYLTVRAGSYSGFYRSVFEDILAVDGQGYQIDDLARRVRSEKYQVSWADFFPTWMKADDRGKVQQIIDRASAIVTKTVFGKWNKIFGEEVQGKELVIEYNVEEGRSYNKETRAYYSTDKHDIYVWFEIKDGTRRFKVNDRSLGFRWFFAFLLFTQFRVARKSERSVLFLFDEPAANLHSAAQQKLLESFPEIAGGDNMLMYTTHSHYMIEPAWLEQTFIVTNRSESPLGSVVESATLDDESLDIRAHRYRTFVNSHPTDTSYFQPIVDRLNIVPSKFDYNLPSIVLEGKSDYYILQYASKLLEIDSIRLLPATGSGTFDALIALSVGWGIKFLFLLDADGAGVKERERYAADHGAPVNALSTINEYLPGASEIESLVDDAAMDIISRELGVSSKPTKKQIRRFFQENLAKNNLLAMGGGFEASARTLLLGLKARLAEL